MFWFPICHYLLSWAQLQPTFKSLRILLCLSMKLKWSIAEIGMQNANKRKSGPGRRRRGAVWREVTIKESSTCSVSFPVSLSQEKRERWGWCKHIMARCKDQRCRWKRSLQSTLVFDFVSLSPLIKISPIKSKMAPANPRIIALFDVDGTLTIPRGGEWPEMNLISSSFCGMWTENAYNIIKDTMQFSAVIFQVII